MRILAGRLFDGTGERVLENVAIEVIDGTISRVIENNPSAEHIDVDLKGLTVLSSFINCHCHMSFSHYRGPFKPQLERPLDARVAIAVPILEENLLSGIATIRIPGERDWMSMLLKKMVSEGLVRGPDVLEAGLAIKSSAGHGMVAYAFDGVESIRKAIRENVKQGSEFIKLFLTGDFTSGTDVYQSYFSKNEIQAAIEEAHHLGMKVTAHAYGGLGLDWGLDCGLDIVEHGSLASPEQLERMGKHGVKLVLTNGIFLNEEMLNIAHPEEKEIVAELTAYRDRIAKGALQARKIGLTMALGSDDSAPWAFKKELQQVVNFGFSPMEAVLMATKNAAEICGLTKSQGTVEVGKVANLIGIDGNPFQDITKIEHVSFVMKRGQIVKYEGVISEFLSQKLEKV